MESLSGYTISYCGRYVGCMNQLKNQLGNQTSTRGGPKWSLTFEKPAILSGRATKGLRVQISNLTWRVLMSPEATPVCFRERALLQSE